MRRRRLWARRGRWRPRRSLVEAVNLLFSAVRRRRPVAALRPAPLNGLLALRQVVLGRFFHRLERLPEDDPNGHHRSVVAPAGLEYGLRVKEQINKTNEHA